MQKDATIRILMMAKSNQNIDAEDNRYWSTRPRRIEVISKERDYIII